MPMTGKTDQTGRGADYPVLGRAGLALGAWLAAAGHTEGPLFRGVDRHGRLLGEITPKLVGRVVKARARRAGMDPAAFGGHSLRSGFLTEGGRQGKGLGDLMALSGHRSTAVAMGYHQAGAVVHNPAARLVG